MKLSGALLTAALLVPAPALAAQERPPQTPAQLARREAIRLDGEGRFTESRAIWQQLIDGAPDSGAKAAAQRRMAMSYGFQGDCPNAVRYHQMVIAYWKTRESAEPQNAFYQQGEMANETARVCIDAGDVNTAERMYRLGYELGNKEPAPRTHPKSLWDYRMAHALARIAARRGDKAEAERQVAAARRALDSDSAMADEQERFFPYLAGYVALYTGDLAGAERWLTRALAREDNRDDAFMHCLLAMTYERLGQAARARELFQKAYQLAEGGHNPPAAYGRRVAGEQVRGS